MSLPARAKAEALWAVCAPSTLTRGEAIRASRKLYRFATRETFKGTIKAGITTRVFFPGRFRMGQPEAATAITVAARKGWYLFVVALAVDLAAAYSGDSDEVHLSLVREVIKRGWLDGRLSDKLIPPTTPEQRAMKKHADLVVNVRKRIKAWNTKAKRATTALKKLNAQLKRLEKKHG